jgi:hypothetical protein
VHTDRLEGRRAFKSVPEQYQDIPFSDPCNCLRLGKIPSSRNIRRCNIYSFGQSCTLSPLPTTPLTKYKRTNIHIIMIHATPEISIRSATTPLYPSAIIPPEPAHWPPHHACQHRRKTFVQRPQSVPSVVTCPCANQCWGIVHNAISRSGAGM